MPTQLELVLIAVVAISCLFILNSNRLRGGKHRARLPPGPPALPLLGHALELPVLRSSPETMKQWADSYGPVTCLSVLGQHIILLNTEQAALDLLEKRSAIYSDRPPFPIFERIGWRDVLAFLPSGPHFLKHRKMVQQPLMKGAVSDFNEVIEDEVNHLLVDLANGSTDIDRSVHRFTASFIMRSTYGIHVATHTDKYFHLLERFERLFHAGAISSWLDFCPLFDRLPVWFPGAWFIKFIQESKPLVRELQDLPLEKAEEDMELNPTKPSFVSRYLENIPKQDRPYSDEYYTLKMVAHQIIAGGSETNWHTIATFIACMIKAPNVQSRARKEIDEQTGRKRLPDLNDRISMPYIECIMKETMRWNPVLPTALPHRCTTDDWYNGMFIPKGSSVLSNAWAMTRDERNYREPYAFRPERFLPKPEGDGENFSVGAAFGWGRRVCPGHYLAENVVWVAIAKILAVFNITSIKDANGIPVTEVDFISSFFRHPVPFHCDIRPRDGLAEALIEETGLLADMQ